MSDKKKTENFYPLDHKKHGIGGVIRTKPVPRKQDKRFKPGEMYAIVFFPKIHGIGKAQWGWRVDTLANSPDAAVSKFIDGMAPGQIWEAYRKAGWCIRKVRITDLGVAWQSKQ